MFLKISVVDAIGWVSLNTQYCESIEVSGQWAKVTMASGKIHVVVHDESVQLLKTFLVEGIGMLTRDYQAKELLKP